MKQDQFRYISKSTTTFVLVVTFKGHVHGEARRLLEEKMLKQQRASRDSNPDCEGIRPSLFALDAEAPGELVPDVPANR
jgi:hypothetical protein